MPRPTDTVLTRTVVLAALLAACSAPSPVAPTAGASPALTTAVPTTAAAPSVPASAVPAATKSGGTKPIVDLTFTGTVELTAKGNGGQCMLGHDASGAVSSFGWMAGEADFPGLGTSLSITEVPGSDAVDIKWVVRSGVDFFGRLGGGVTLSPDHHQIGLDAEMPPTGDLTEHVRGVITCP